MAALEEQSASEPAMVGDGSGGGGGSLPVEGHLVPTAEEKARIDALRQQARDALDPRLLEEVRKWAVNKTEDQLLLQFVRARPERNGGVVEALRLVERSMRWRHLHNVDHVFEKHYPLDLHMELKQRINHAFFFGHNRDGDPVYWNSMPSVIDYNHADLLPGKLSLNDMTTLWIQEMEYREKVLFPRASEAAGRVVNRMMVVLDVNHVSLKILGTLNYLKATIALNDNFYPESVSTIVVTNTPFFINVLMKAVLPLLPAATKQKIRFCRDDGHAELLELIGDASLIPREHGGSGPSKDELNQQYVEQVRTVLAQEAGDPADPVQQSFENLASDPDKDWAAGQLSRAAAST